MKNSRLNLKAPRVKIAYTVQLLRGLAVYVISVFGYALMNKGEEQNSITTSESKAEVFLERKIYKIIE